MFWLIPTAIGAGLGLLKNAQEQNRFDNEKDVQSATTRYSPWTHMQAAAPQRGSGLFGNLAGGALSGYLMGSAFGGADPAGGTEGLAAGGGPSLGVVGGGAGGYDMGLGGMATPSVSANPVASMAALGASQGNSPLGGIGSKNNFNFLQGYNPYALMGRKSY